MIRGKSDSPQAQKLLRYAHRKGIVRSRNLITLGLSRSLLQRLCERDLLIRRGRGLYMVADGMGTEHHTLVEAMRRVPHGVICLFSALRFHRLTTQNSPDVWMAIDRKARLPRVDRPPIQYVRLSGAARTEGVEQHRLEGVDVPVYAAAKTVADCFKYRNKIGLDVALESLREYCLKGRSIPELMRYAAICRVSRVIQPYMEAMTT